MYNAGLAHYLHEEIKGAFSSPLKLNKIDICQIFVTCNSKLIDEKSINNRVSRRSIQ